MSGDGAATGTGSIDPHAWPMHDLCMATKTISIETDVYDLLGENDAWIAATALAYGATLVGRDPAFARVPRLDYARF